MAFAYTVAKKGMFANFRYAIVNFTNAGAGTGGVISYADIGMRYLYYAGASNKTTQAATTVMVELNTGASAAENGSVKLTCVASEAGEVFILGI